MVDDFDVRLVALVLKNGNCNHMDCSACPMMDDCLSKNLSKPEIVELTGKWMKKNRVNHRDLLPHLF